MSIEIESESLSEVVFSNLGFKHVGSFENQLTQLNFQKNPVENEKIMRNCLFYIFPK